MKKLMGGLVGLCLLLGCAVIARAQEMSGGMAGVNQPPKVLTVTREWLKPGKSGAMHSKSESAFVQAFARAKWPTHYIAMESLSGKPRCLFLTGYDSFEAWEKDAMDVQKKSALSSALDGAEVADGNLLDSVDMSAYTYHEDQSLRGGVDLPHMRYFEFEVFQVRPGHTKEWNEAVQMVKAAYQKADPDVHWAMYEAMFGRSGGTYVVITPRKSAKELDMGMMVGKKFADAMGADGMKRLEELSAASIESSETNLFAINPQMSYASDDWIKADPDFWKPKTHTAAPKKADEKPATAQ